MDNRPWGPFFVSFYLTGCVSSPAMLYLTYGLLAGLGFAYSGVPLKFSLRLFPDKRGLASDLTGGMGLLVIASPVVESHSKTRCLLCFSEQLTGLYCYICVILH